MMNEEDQLAEQRAILGDEYLTQDQKMERILALFPDDDFEEEAAVVELPAVNLDGFSQSRLAEELAKADLSKLDFEIATLETAIPTLGTEEERENGRDRLAVARHLRDESILDTSALSDEDFQAKVVAAGMEAERLFLEVDKRIAEGFGVANQELGTEDSITVAEAKRVADVAMREQLALEDKARHRESLRRYPDVVLDTAKPLIASMRQEAHTEALREATKVGDHEKVAVLQLKAAMSPEEWYEKYPDEYKATALAARDAVEKDFGKRTLQRYRASVDLQFGEGNLESQAFLGDGDFVTRDQATGTGYYDAAGDVRGKHADYIESPEYKEQARLAGLQDKYEPTTYGE
jgi:hypothetical protein